MIRDNKHLSAHVLSAIVLEKSKQIAKWGIQDRPIADWLCILGEEVGEANKAYLELMFDPKNYDNHYDNLIEELIQISTVAANVADALENTRRMRSEHFQALKDIITEAWTNTKEKN